MLAQEVIRKKRDGGRLDTDEIRFLVRGLTDGSISEGQIAAFAMAVYFNGMDMDERIALTREMMHSGDVLDWRSLDLPGPLLDKHSTGGVGDKVSLVLAPLVAAAGGFVPMISGRGLGHTGGTLDKMDAIPGYTTAPDSERFRRVVREVGCAVIGQTARLAPADRRFYAIRDVTATVESVALITASILSKKLAAGLDALVMDVKTGSGAFAASLEMATELADSIVAVANGAGLATSALITDMDRVLGGTVGNALEVREAVDFLAGRRDPRLEDCVLSLAAEMLRLGGLAADAAEGRARASAVLDDGRAREKFAAMVSALGGPADFVERPAAYLPAAAVVEACYPERPGFVRAMDTRAVGVAVVDLGGGRRRAEDTVDHAVGLSDVAPPGAAVGPERALAIVHAASREDWQRACAALRRAVAVDEAAPGEAGEVVLRTLRTETTR